MVTRKPVLRKAGTWIVIHIQVSRGCPKFSETRRCNEAIAKQPVSLAGKRR
jgi:hypothetical protein